MNIIVSSIVLLVLNAFGWLTLINNGMKVSGLPSSWGGFFSVVLIAVVFTASRHVIALVSTSVSIRIATFFVKNSAVEIALITLLASMVVLLFAGWPILSLTGLIMPGSIELHGFWLTLVCGTLLLMARIPPIKITP